MLVPLAFDAVSVDCKSINWWSLLNVLGLLVLDLYIFLQLVNICLATLKAFKESSYSIHETQKHCEQNKANHRYYSNADIPSEATLLLVSIVNVIETLEKSSVYRPEYLVDVQEFEGFFDQVYC